VCVWNCINKQYLYQSNQIVLVERINNYACVRHTECMYDLTDDTAKDVIEIIGMHKWRSHAAPHTSLTFYRNGNIARVISIVEIAQRGLRLLPD
jgi:hypothetical protein